MELSRKQQQAILAAMLEEGQGMTKKDQDQEAANALSSSPGQNQEQQAALYGPAGRADHQIGESITFASLDTGGKNLTGKILYVRAPSPAVQGGRTHPTTYITYVEGEAFPRIVYISDIIEEKR